MLPFFYNLYFNNFKKKLNNYTKIKQQESNVKICSVLSVYENFKDKPKLNLNRAIIFILFIFLLNKARGYKTPSYYIPIL